MIRGRPFFVYLLLATMIVAPLAVLWQRQSRLEARYTQLGRSQVVIAEDRVDRAVAGCETTNAISASIVQTEGSSSPVKLTNRERLALRSYLERAVETAAHPKTCTIESLHLGELAAVADRP